MTGLGARVGRQLVTVDGVAHPVLEMTRQEFERLPEYSTSIPTGVTIGKRWRRCILPGHLSGFQGAAADIQHWRIGEYSRESVTHPGEVDITWYFPQIVEPEQVGMTSPDTDPWHLIEALTVLIGNEEMPNGWWLQSPDCDEVEIYCPTCLHRARTIIDKLYALGWWKEREDKEGFDAGIEDEVDRAADCHYCGKPLFITLTREGILEELDEFERDTPEKLRGRPPHEIQRLLWVLEDDLKPRVYALVDRYLSLADKSASGGHQ